MGSCEFSVVIFQATTETRKQIINTNDLTSYINLSVDFVGWNFQVYWKVLANKSIFEKFYLNINNLYPWSSAVSPEISCLSVISPAHDKLRFFPCLAINKISWKWKCIFSEGYNLGTCLLFKGNNHEIIVLKFKEMARLQGWYACQLFKDENQDRKTSQR